MKESYMISSFFSDIKQESLSFKIDKTNNVSVKCDGIIWSVESTESQGVVSVE